jgi:hypothetical protein
MTSKTTPECLQAVCGAFAITPGAGGEAGAKASAEPPASNCLGKDPIGGFAKGMGIYTECGTANSGQRAAAAMHGKAAAGLGFKPDALTGAGSEAIIPTGGGLRFESGAAGTRLGGFSFHNALPHFGGRQKAGGGALKQLSSGCASYCGKGLFHAAGNSACQRFGGSQGGLREFMEGASQDAASHANSLGGGQIICISATGRLSTGRGCRCSPAAPDSRGIGILSPAGPVALGRACSGLNCAAGGNGESFARRAKAKNGAHAIEAPEQIGLGSSANGLAKTDG